MTWKWMIWVLLCFLSALACDGPPSYPEELRPRVRLSERTHAELTLDPGTGIPYATVFQHPVAGFDAVDYGFGFGDTNQWFCMKTAADGTCIAYGVHLGRDTRVDKTPVGTEVLAPADGIVRITTDIRFGGYGSDTKANAHYQGCVVLLEHLFGNGQAVTTLLGHLECDSGPPVGTLVQRGDPVGSVGHYWHGAGQSTDWHHVHWSMRAGRFSATRYTRADLTPYVQGYAPSSEFRVDPQSGIYTHPLWLDPFVVVASHDGEDTSVDVRVRHHPSGSLLRDPDGGYWFVLDETTIASVPPATARSDRYPMEAAIPVSFEEVGCYAHASDIASYGPVTLYVRPGTNSVVMAYDLTRERYDMINWEALLSWGFQEEDILHGDEGSFYEEAYHDKGFRLLRPGTLVKAVDASEVALITAQQTRLPIYSEEVFQRAGFQWNRITHVPASVIDDVAGPREDRVLRMEDLEQCAVSPECPGGGACGGGGWEPEAPDAATPPPVIEPAPPTTLPDAVTITVITSVDMNEFSLWLQSDTRYAAPAETAADCAVEARLVQCLVVADARESLGFWMNTGVPSTPWSPGLNWETDLCDPFADVSVTRGHEVVPLHMVQIGDGCRFVIGGEE